MLAGKVIRFNRLKRKILFINLNQSVKLKLIVLQNIKLGQSRGPTLIITETASSGYKSDILYEPKQVQPQY